MSRSAASSRRPFGASSNRQTNTNGGSDESLCHSPPWRLGQRAGTGAAGAKSARVGEEMADRVRWIRTYAVAEPDGRIGSVCIYEASDPESDPGAWPTRRGAERKTFRFVPQVPSSRTRTRRSAPRPREGGLVAALPVASQKTEYETHVVEQRRTSMKNPFGASMLAGTDVDQYRTGIRRRCDTPGARS